MFVSMACKEPSGRGGREMCSPVDGMNDGGRGRQWQEDLGSDGFVVVRCVTILGTVGVCFDGYLRGSFSETWV